jgi:hypothetical protein
MSKNEATLRDLLEKKGFDVSDLWNRNYFYVKRWYAEMSDGTLYNLGSNFLEAVENIVNDKITIEEE